MQVMGKDEEIGTLGAEHGVNGRKDKLCYMTDGEQLLKSGILYTF